MFKKLRRKIIIYTMLSMFGLLAILLSAINITNFVMVAEEADKITLRLSEQKPDDPSKDMPGMLYFTYSEKDNKLTNFHMENSISEAEAISWAQSLLSGASKGWSKINYRYRVNGNKNRTVVVVDQSRELKPSYQILWISLVVSVVGLLITFVIIFFVSKRIIKPLEESDNKQKRFIADAAMTLKTPLSVISIDNATLINMHGEEAANKSIRHQVKKLMDMSTDLNSLAVMSTVEVKTEEINLSNILLEIISQYKYPFMDNKKELIIDIASDLLITGDTGMIRKMLLELMDNALKYSDSKTHIVLKQEEKRILLEITNDCKGIPDGSLDKVFDKFLRLDFKDHSKFDGAGIGLSIVKEIVDKHHGRILAKGENDNFIIKIEF